MNPLQPTITSNPSSLVSIDHYQKGVDLLHSNPVEAFKHFQAAVTKEPDHAMAHFTLGQMLQEHGGDLVPNGTDHGALAVSHLERARNLLASGNLKGITGMNPGAEAGQRLSDTHFRIAQLKGVQGKTDEAIASIKSFILLNAFNSKATIEATIFLGGQHIKAGNYIEACKCFKGLIDRHHDCTEEQFEKIIDHYVTSLIGFGSQANGRGFNAQILNEILYYKGFDVTTAKDPNELLKTVKSLSQHEAMFPAFVAPLCRHAIGIFKAILQTAVREEGLSPNDPKVAKMVSDYLNLSMTWATGLRGKGKSLDCLLICKDILKIDPNFSRALVSIGELLMENKKYAEAAPFFAKAYSLDKDDQFVTNNLGWCCLFAKNDNAYKFFEKYCQKWEELDKFIPNTMPVTKELRLAQTACSMKEGRIENSFLLYNQLLSLKPIPLDITKFCLLVANGFTEVSKIAGLQSEYYKDIGALFQMMANKDPIGDQELSAIKAILYSVTKKPAFESETYEHMAKYAQSQGNNVAFADYQTKKAKYPAAPVRPFIGPKLPPNYVPPSAQTGHGSSGQMNIDDTLIKLDAFLNSREFGPGRALALESLNSPDILTTPRMMRLCRALGYLCSQNGEIAKAMVIDEIARKQNFDINDVNLIKKILSISDYDARAYVKPKGDSSKDSKEKKKV